MNQNGTCNTLVIDVGTSSMRGILYRETGHILVFRQIKYQPRYEAADIVEQAPHDWHHALHEIVRQIVQEASDQSVPIDLISVTAQRSSVIPVDRSGTALDNAIMWADKRSEALCQQLSADNQLVFKRSGTLVNTVYSGGKMAWFIANRPQLYRQTYKLVNVAEYVIHIMTGEFKSDHTYGSRSNLMNIRTRQWDKDLLKLFHIDEAVLCELTEPGSIVGRINRRFSRQTGIAEGTPVISAGGDQQCGAVGQGVYREGVAAVVAGTGAFILAACDEVPAGLEPQVI